MKLKNFVLTPLDISIPVLIGEATEIMLWSGMFKNCSQEVTSEYRLIKRFFLLLYGL